MFVFIESLGGWPCVRMALQNLTRVPIPCPASELVKQGDVLTLRADAERHPKTNKKKICLLRLSFPKCYSSTS